MNHHCCDFFRGLLGYCRKMLKSQKWAQIFILPIMVIIRLTFFVFWRARYNTFISFLIFSCFIENFHIWIIAVNNNCIWNIVSSFSGIHKIYCNCKNNYSQHVKYLSRSFLILGSRIGFIFGLELKSGHLRLGGKILVLNKKARQSQIVNTLIDSENELTISGNKIRVTKMT